MAASSSVNPSAGNSVMMVGLVTQVVTLVIFAIMSADVYFRIRNFRGELENATIELRNTRRFPGLITAIIIAYIAIVIRCIYRIIEMAGGWRNPVMQNQTSFILLDSVMCVIAALVLNAFHPGFLFKQSYATMKEEGLNLTNTQLDLMDESTEMRRDVHTFGEVA